MAGEATARRCRLPRDARKSGVKPSWHSSLSAAVRLVPAERFLIFFAGAGVRRSIAEVAAPGARDRCVPRNADPSQWARRQDGWAVLGRTNGAGNGRDEMTEIRVFSTIGMRTVLEELVPGFELAHGCTVARVYDSSVAAMKRIAAGESGDVAVFTAGAIDDLIAQGKMRGPHRPHALRSSGSRCAEARRSRTFRHRTCSRPRCSPRNPSRIPRPARAGFISSA